MLNVNLSKCVLCTESNVTIRSIKIFCCHGIEVISRILLSAMSMIAYLLSFGYWTQAKNLYKDEEEISLQKDIGTLSGVLDRGLYLKRECLCSVKIEKLGEEESFNIIQMINRKAMDCLNCSNQNFSVVIHGLNHKISYQEYEEGKDLKKNEVVSLVSMNKNEEIQYPLKARLVYFQIDIK